MEPVKHRFLSAIVLIALPFTCFAQSADPTALPAASRQLPDWQSYLSLGVRTASAGFVYTDPATGVRVVKVTSPSIPAQNDFAWHDYSEGGPHISAEWGGGYHTLFLSVRDGPEIQKWLVDYQRGAGLSNWRQFPVGPYPSTDLTAAFANSAGAQRIMYILHGGRLYRFNTETMAVESETHIPGTGVEMPNVGGALHWLQSSANDDWLVFQWSDGQTGANRVYAFQRSTGTILNRFFPGLDEPALDRNGGFVAIRDGGGGDATCPDTHAVDIWHLWDLASDSVTCKGPAYIPHTGWNRGYFATHDSSNNGHNYYYRRASDETVPTAGYADGNAFLVNHHASQWIQSATDASQWYFGSNFNEGRVKAIGWTAHSGEIYRTDINWSPAYGKPTIGVRAAYQHDGNLATDTLAVATSLAAMTEGSIFYDSGTQTLYGWMHGGGNLTDRVYLAAPSTVHDGMGVRRLDGSNVRLVAHHYAWFPSLPPGEDPYLRQPHATVSPDGKLIMFKSNMGSLLGRRDVFVVEVPDDGESDPEPDPDPPPPGQAEPVVWTNVVNAIASGSTLTENCGCGDSGAQSEQVIESGDGFMEFTAGVDDEMYGAGLAFGNSNNNASDIDFAFVPSWHGWAEVRENGTYRTEVAYVQGDRFRIAIEDGQVNYYKYSGETLELVHSNASPVLNYPLHVDTGLQGPGTVVLDAVISSEASDPPPPPPPSGEVTWVNIMNAIADGNSLTESGGVGDSGAQSAEAIESGDGYMEFTALEADTMRSAGLGINETHNGFDDIEFAIVLRDNGWAEVRESGTYRWDIPYVAGDRFRIAIEGGVIKYYKFVNGEPALQYTNSTPSTLAYPISVDAALYSPGSTLSDVVLTEVE